ncbi:MAG TPA: hypothetical protein PLU66_08490 [Trueperaceae bacterium]|nr:hypothetical protein [Trueperaceae bacterium]
MDLLAAVPVWAYFVLLLLTYVVAHILTFDPGRLLPKRRAFIGRLGSAVLLLLALVFFQRDDPVTLLLSLSLAVAGGFVSGRSTLPPAGRGSGGKRDE